MSLLLFRSRINACTKVLPPTNRSMRVLTRIIDFKNDKTLPIRSLSTSLHWQKPVLTSSKATPLLQTSKYFFSSKNGQKKTGNNDDSSENANQEYFRIEPEDPFGLLLNDESDSLESILPPELHRDAVTGRVLSSTDSSKTSGVSRVSDREKRILNMDSMEHDVQLMDSVQKHWTSKGTDEETGLPKELNDLGERIRESDMATNVLGRSPKAQTTKEVLDDGSEFISSDDTGFSQPLTMDEFQTFQKFMKTKHKVEVGVDDLPVTTQVKTDGRYLKHDSSNDNDPDNVDLSLKWLTARAQRQMDESLDDNPYSDLMPGDLSPSPVVNRKRAKLIPHNQLYFNNLALLQHFISPTGQIMNRTQTRLGARDQRRVARLIKRGRALGVLPYVGQFKVENHGWLHSKDIHKERQWERALRQRGLVVQKSATSTNKVE